ncbi:unnamed protein product [Schistosoma guineensis]|nr:unnamed protein product [Schistosoma guineensis]
MCSYLTNYTLYFLFLITTLLKMNYCCQKLGSPCTGTIFRRCCGKLLCEYDMLGAGTCQNCIRSNYACMKNSQCCSKYCKFLVCV